jgi:AraC-like DNA-binding protein
MGTALSTAPELSAISQLFKKAPFGVAFHGETRMLAGERLKGLHLLPSFAQLIELMDIFQLLAGSSEYAILNNEHMSLPFVLKDKIRMGAVYEYIGANFNRKPDVNVVAEKVNLTTPAFCRYFKRQVNMTFTDFVNQYRIDMAKNFLIQDKNVTEVCYSVGFESLSYFNKLFNQVVGENPSDFKKKWLKR